MISFSIDRMSASIFLQWTGGSVLVKVVLLQGSVVDLPRQPRNTGFQLDFQLVFWCFFSVVIQRSPGFGSAPGFCSGRRGRLSAFQLPTAASSTSCVVAGRTPCNSHSVYDCVGDRDSQRSCYPYVTQSEIRRN